MQRATVVGVCLTAFLILNAAPKRPSFQEYPPDGTFGGTAAEPRITTAWQQKYRTRIRRGAASSEGFRRGSEYVETTGPNFAGHYRVVNWGCGSGCLMMVIVDLNTGTVYPPPMSVGASGEDRLIIPNLGTGWGDFDFRIDSRLFVMRTCRWGSRNPKSPLYRGMGFCGTSYYTIEPRGFRVIQRISEELLPSPE
jgi:hypothetical protein